MIMRIFAEAGSSGFLGPHPSRTVSTLLGTVLTLLFFALLVKLLNRLMKSMWKFAKTVETNYVTFPVPSPPGPGTDATADVAAGGDADAESGPEHGGDNG